MRSRRTLQSPLIAIVAALVSVECASQTGAAQLTGTYRLSICTSRCSTADSGVVRGFLVLFPDPVELGSLPPAARDSLVRQSLWLLRKSAVANACFALPTGPTNIGGRDLYAGIIRRGLTVWEKDGPRIRVRLYQSPDAAYTLDGTVTGVEYKGRGKQDNCCFGRNPTTFFRAVRISEPDLAACL